MIVKNYSNQYIPRDKNVAGVRVAFENGNYVRDLTVIRDLRKRSEMQRTIRQATLDGYFIITW